uniref:hypothetical protein n=1 Tax=uncultured Phascolarctobacterium sp. TaxID=512296 RepID=UPI0025D0B2A0
ETLARTFVFGYCSVFKVLLAVFDDLYSILHLLDVVNYFFSSFLTAYLQKFTLFRGALLFYKIFTKKASPI